MYDSQWAHAAEQSAICAWGYGRPEYLELWEELAAGLDG